MEFVHRNKPHDTVRISKWLFEIRTQESPLASRHIDSPDQRPILPTACEPLSPTADGESDARVFPYPRSQTTARRPAEREALLESGYSTAAEDTNFGLAIVTEVVEAHGWSIAVGESTVGRLRLAVSLAE
nr:hypothetical protein [Natrinema soli]